MRRYSIKNRLYIFIISVVLLVAVATTLISYIANTKQINDFYKKSTIDNAKNFSVTIDVEFIKELKTIVKSDEYQQLRKQAEDEDNNELIEDYLKNKGLWTKYSNIRQQIDEYIKNIQNIKYLYLITFEGIDSNYDMYLIDDSTTDLYETGYYEKREPEFEGLDLKTAEPTISNGDWGWLCSGYQPLYDNQGNFVCLVGCDISMEAVMNARHTYLTYIIVSTLVILLAVLIGAFMILNKTLIKPLNNITTMVKKFRPTKNIEEANIIDLNINSKNEIGEIYKNIQTMEISIIQYLNQMIDMKEDIDRKNTKISQLSTKSYKDALTNVGNKASYTKAVNKLNQQISAKSNIPFAIVMIDINNLKSVNDECGHKYGDDYIVGCCQMICNAFKHSPVYRIGGDEFVVIAQGYDYENRIDICRELRLAFDESYNKTDNLYNRYSAAIGMSDYTSNDMSVDIVFKRADKLMYESKQRFKSVYGKYR